MSTGGRPGRPRKRDAPWTTDEFRTVGMALHGGAYGWQAALARRLGVSDRTVRSWAAGRTAVPERVQQEMTRMTGAKDEPESKFRRDEWIIGSGPPHELGECREYLIHTWPPRFIARLVNISERTGQPLTAEGDVDGSIGIVYRVDPGMDLAEFQWIDRPPSGKHLIMLLEQAGNYIESEEERVKAAAEARGVVDDEDLDPDDDE